MSRPTSGRQSAAVLTGSRQSQLGTAATDAFTERRTHLASDAVVAKLRLVSRIPSRNDRENPRQVTDGSHNYRNRIN